MHEGMRFLDRVAAIGEKNNNRRLTRQQRSRLELQEAAALAVAPHHSGPAGSTGGPPKCDEESGLPFFFHSIQKQVTQAEQGRLLQLAAEAAWACRASQPPRGHAGAGAPAAGCGQCTTPALGGSARSAHLTVGGCTFSVSAFTLAAAAAGRVCGAGR